MADVSLTQAGTGKTINIPQDQWANPDYQAGLVNRGFGLSPAPSSPSLTVNSNQLTSAPLFTNQMQEQVQNMLGTAPEQISFSDALAQVRNQITPISNDENAAIRSQVALEFAPRLQRQQTINSNQQNLFNARAAQKSGGTFGAGQREQFGQTEIGTEAQRTMTELENLQNLEAQSRIAARESSNRQEQTNYLQLADQAVARSQQIVNDWFGRWESQRDFSLKQQQMQAQQNALVWEQLQTLDDQSLAQLGYDNAKIQQIEQSMGLPSGFMKAYRETQKRASDATTQAEYDKAFNDMQSYSLKIPEGMTLPYRIGGEEYIIEGRQIDTQIISNNGGVWSVNKNTGEVKMLKAPTSVSGTKKINPSAEFSKWYYDTFGQLANPTDPNVFVEWQRWQQTGKGANSTPTKRYDSDSIPTDLNAELIQNIQSGANLLDIMNIYNDVDPALINTYYKAYTG